MSPPPWETIDGKPVGIRRAKPEQPKQQSNTRTEEDEPASVFVWVAAAMIVAIVIGLIFGGAR